eukprot:COSAG02_NODE_7334_length_3059_cov_2.657770_2_plen_151_part_00
MYRYNVRVTTGRFFSSQICHSFRIAADWNCSQIASHFGLPATAVKLPVISDCLQLQSNCQSFRTACNCSQHQRQDLCKRRGHHSATERTAVLSVTSKPELHKHCAQIVRTKPVWDIEQMFRDLLQTVYVRQIHSNSGSRKQHHLNHLRHR